MKDKALVILMSSVACIALVLFLLILGHWPEAVIAILLFAIVLGMYAANRPRGYW